MSTPIDVNFNMDNYRDSGRCKIYQYQELLRKLMYLNTYGRSDISFVIECLSQFYHDQNIMDMNGLKKIFTFHGTKHEMLNRMRVLLY